VRRLLGITVALISIVGGLGAVRAQGVPPANVAPDAAEEVARQGALRLDLLQAQLLLATGQLSAAREAYQQLRGNMADSAEPASGLAEVARSSGQSRLSGALLAEALLLAPDNPAIAQALAANQRARAPRLRFDLDQRLQRGGGGSRADITVGEVGGQAPIGDAWRVGATQGIAYVNARKLQRANGTIGNFSGVRERTEVFVQYERIEGQTFTATVFADEWSGGFGLMGRFPDDYGQTSLRAEYRRPIWEFVEAIIAGATRDRVAVERMQRFSERLSARIDAALNRYGIPRDDDDVLRSATLRGEVRLDTLGDVRGLSLAYVLDAEYVLRRDQRTAPGGGNFLALPIRDREVHAGLLAYADTFGDAQAEGQFTWRTSIGYGADRYGLSGPLAFASVGYVRGAFEVSLRAGYVRNIGRATGETTSFGVGLTWVF
jgi:hypothetical protein